MMLGPKAANWEKRRDADQAIHLMEANGGTDYDVEEALCLLLQAKISIEAGMTPRDYLTSEHYTQGTPRRRLLVRLEHHCRCPVVGVSSYR